MFRSARGPRALAFPDVGKGGRTSNSESAIKQHAESTDHNIHPEDVQILERGVVSYSKRLFLESWHYTLDSDAVNERKAFPRAYVPLIQNQERDHGLVAQAPTNFYFLALMKVNRSHQRFRNKKIRSA